MEGLEPTAKQTELLQSLSAIDTLSSAMKSNIVPNQEYLLQGSILDSNVEILLHRLRGLCDNTDVGLESFHDHEACFVLSSPTTQPSQQLTLRVRRAVDDTSAPWHLRYVRFIDVLIAAYLKCIRSRTHLARSFILGPVGPEVVNYVSKDSCSDC